MFKQSDINAHVEDTFRPIEVPNVHVIDLAEAREILSAADIREIMGLGSSDSYHEMHESDLKY